MHGRFGLKYPTINVVGLVYIKFLALVTVGRINFKAHGGVGHVSSLYVGRVSISIRDRRNHFITA